MEIIAVRAYDWVVYVADGFSAVGILLGPFQQWTLRCQVSGEILTILVMTGTRLSESTRPEIHQFWSDNAWTRNVENAAGI